MRYIDADSCRRNSVARRNYYADHDKRLRDTINAGVAGLGILLSAAPKWAGIVHGLGDRVGHIIRTRDSVEEAVYGHPKEWKPSPYHIDEVGLASRYGVPPETFRAWPDFPKPISDFGRFVPPGREWWSLSVLSAWERRHSRSLPISMVAAAIAHERISQKNSKQDRPVRGQALPAPAYRSAPRPIKYERLPPEREIELIRRAQNGDQSARQEIIASVQPLIELIAAGYAKGPRSDFEEIISSINVQRGIYDAIDKFDPYKGYRLATFLRNPIRWAVMAYLKCERRQPPSISLSTPINKSDPESLLLGDTIVDESYDNGDDFDYEGACEKLDGMLAVLSDRERLVIESRYGLNGKSARIFREIAVDLNLSAERVRQIEAAAFLKARLPADVRS
jgi:RNA polymerase sporulation-specific sigma factor